MGLRDWKVQEWFRAASLWCLLTLLCFAPSALAQYHFDSWTADDGLPQNSAQAILQTHDGYLWLATFDGLVRFDGVRFTVFNSSNRPGVESNRFTCLYGDPEGTLWIGTADAGLTRYRQGTFSTYPPPPYLAKTTRVTGLAGDAAGHLWALMSDHELQRPLSGWCAQKSALAGSEVRRRSARAVTPKGWR
jgi:ligand-binding sensor domain-containing protein